MTSADLDVLEDRGDPVAVAVLAAEAARVLNRLTIPAPTPGWDGWEDVGDLYRVLGELRALVDRLPQAFDQLARHLTREGVRYRSDAGTADDPEALIATAAHALGVARQGAEQIGEHLAVAHSATSHLAPIE